MKAPIALAHKFVKAIPEKLEERTLYVSLEYATVTHKCCCGCGKEVVTPISPTDWQLTFDGDSISLHPSIGNWSFPCQSHYWIRRNRIKWAPQLSKQMIAAGRALDRLAKEQYFEGTVSPESSVGDLATSRSRMGLWARLIKWFS